MIWTNEKTIEIILQSFYHFKCELKNDRITNFHFSGLRVCFVLGVNFFIIRQLKGIIRYKLSSCTPEKSILLESSVKDWFLKIKIRRTIFRRIIFRRICATFFYVFLSRTYLLKPHKHLKDKISQKNGLKTKNYKIVLKFCIQILYLQLKTSSRHFPHWIWYYKLDELTIRFFNQEVFFWNNILSRTF